MKKKFFIALISIVLISVTFTACGKESSKKNTTSNKHKVEETKKDDSKDKDSSKKEELDTDKKEESNNKKDDTVTSSNNQGNVGNQGNGVIENTVLNSVGDDSGARPSDFYISELISNFEQLAIDANNNGDFSIVSSMITQDSSFYKKEKETIESSYRNNVKYNLLDYNIEQIKAIDNKTYKAYVVENIEVKEGNESNFQAKQFKHIYTIKFDDSGIGINNKEEWN